MDCCGSAGAWSDGQRCLEVQGGAQELDRDGGRDAFGHDGMVCTFGLAGPAMRGSDWRTRGAVGCETAGFDGEDGHGAPEGETRFAAISATRAFGPLTSAAAGVCSRGSFDITGQSGPATGIAEAAGDHRVTSAAAGLRASCRRGVGASCLVPMSVPDVIWTRSDGHAETGAGERSVEAEDSEAAAIEAGMPLCRAMARP